MQPLKGGGRRMGNYYLVWSGLMEVLNVQNIKKVLFVLEVARGRFYFSYSVILWSIFSVVRNRY